MRAAVLGSPIAHSLSPVLHRAAYDALGLAWTYDAIEVLPADLASFVGSLDATWAGLSLTMPLKQTVLPLLDSASKLVVGTGAANTVLLLGGECRGENTDVAGIVEALREAGVSSVAQSVVLGGGATAASAVAALQQLGDPAPTVLVRSALRAGPLLAAAARLGAQPVLGPLTARALTLALAEPVTVVISTAPAGALDALAVELTLPDDVPTLLDVVYAPWPTVLGSAYARAGGTVVGGAAMLLHQAAAQVELMTGRMAPLEAMRAALDEASSRT